MIRSFTIAWGCLLLVIAAGCGKPTAQISGKAVFEDGSPVKGAVCVVNFEPAKDSTAEVRKAASGTIDEDGSFEMLTRKRGDGVFKGQYQVTFMVLKSPRYGGLLVPEKYTIADTTPFSIDVTKDQHDLLFELEKLE